MAQGMIDRNSVAPVPTSQIIGALEETMATQADVHSLVQTLAVRLQQIRRAGPDKINKSAEVTLIGQSDVAQRITTLRGGMQETIGILHQVLEELEI